MSSYTGERESSPAPVMIKPVYGYLRLVDRKTGQQSRSFPIDAQHLSIGRDPSCHIRMIYESVSRVHAEIEMSLLENTATLHVISPNGVIFKPFTGPSSKLSKGCSRVLSSGDRICINKKNFVFDYADTSDYASTLDPTAFGTPVRQSGSTDTPHKSHVKVRSRPSYRMSLGPSDKMGDVMPGSPARRRSMNAMGGGGNTPRKSALNQEVPNEEEEREQEQEAEEPLVWVDEMGNGDQVVLEVCEEEEEDEDEPTSPSPTPATLPKTPRSVPLPVSMDTPYAAAAPTPGTPIATASPQRVPAKIAMSTPKGRMSLFKHTVLQSARKQWIATRPSGVDGAIEQGTVEIRRKSTSPKRAAAVAVQPEEASDEEEDEEQEHEQEAQDAYYDQEQEQNDDELAPAETLTEVQGGQTLQWVEEDGQAQEVSFESDSAEDSFEADVSLDLPGQQVLQLDIAPSTTTEEGGLDQAINVEEEEQYEQDGEEAYEEEGVVAEYQEGAEGEEIQQEYEREQHADAELGEQEEEDDEEDKELVAAIAKYTPKATRKFENFYTPQITRPQGQPRRSLAGIGGPVWRPPRTPSTPNPLGGGAYRPASSPGRRSVVETGSAFRKEEKSFKKEWEEEEEEEAKVLATPSKSRLMQAQLAEIKHRRQSLATPRQLPSAPTSFKTPIQAPFSFSKPAHPVLNPTSTPVQRASTAKEDTDNSGVANQPPSTPLDSIKARLDRMKHEALVRQAAREQSREPRAAPTFATPQPKRASKSTGMVQSQSWTVNPVRVARFALPDESRLAPLPASHSPSTPAGPTAQMKETRTLAPIPSTPDTPSLGPMGGDGDSSVSSMHTPIRGQSAGTPFKLVKGRSPQKSPIASIKSSAPHEANYHAAAVLASPNPAPSKAATSPSNNTTSTSRLPPKTPNFSGMKQMFNTQPAPPKTPNFSGMREMLWSNEAPAAPITPDMGGIKRLYPTIPVMATPNMTGLEGMYPESQPEGEEEEEEGTENPSSSSEEEEPIEEKGSAVRRAARISPATVKSTQPALSEKSIGRPTSASGAPQRSTRERVVSPSKPSRVVQQKEAVAVDSESEIEEPIEYKAPKAALAPKRSATSATKTANKSSAGKSTFGREKSQQQDEEEEEEADEDVEVIMEESEPAKPSRSRKARVPAASSIKEDGKSTSTSTKAVSSTRTKAASSTAKATASTRGSATATTAKSKKSALGESQRQLQAETADENDDNDDDADEEEEDDDPLAGPVTGAAKRTTRVKKTTTSKTDSKKAKENDPAPAPARRTRTAAASASTTTTTTSAAAAKKAAAAAPASPETKSAPTRATRATKVTRGTAKTTEKEKDKENRQPGEVTSTSTRVTRSRR